MSASGTPPAAVDVSSLPGLPSPVAEIGSPAAALPEPAAPAVSDPAVSGVTVNPQAASSESTLAALAPVSSPTSDALSPASPTQLAVVREMRAERKKSMVFADGWADVQERTFLRWVNYQLSKRREKIESLRTGLSDGVHLCTLIEVLSKRALPARPNRVAKSQIVHLDNLRIAFAYLENTKGVHIVGIQPQSVQEGNIKIILGLVWGLIQTFQIAEQKPKPKPATAAKSVEAGTGDSSASSVPTAAAASSGSSSSELLKWVNQQIEPFGVGRAEDFGKSWQDGRILKALVESLDASASRQLSFEGDAVELVEAAIRKAEDVYAIPPLMDASDIVHRPQEHALMTYISFFREIFAERAAVDEAEAAAATAAMAAMAVEASRAAAAESASLRADTDVARSASLLQLPMSPFGGDGGENMESVVVPLSPMRIERTIEPVLGAVDEHETPPGDESVEVERNLAATDFTDEANVNMSQRTRVNTHAELVGAYIDSASLDAVVSPTPKTVEPVAKSTRSAVAPPIPARSPAAALIAAAVPLPAASPVSSAGAPSAMSPAAPAGADDKVVDSEPYDSEAQAKKDALTASMDIERHVAATHITSSRKDEQKPDINAVEDYSQPEEDAEGKLPGETLQQSIDRRIEKLMNAIEICVVTPDHAYLQSDSNGVVRAHEVNTAAATWTIVDGAGGWKFLRDYQSRYLSSDEDGRISVTKKSPKCRWRIVRGHTQYFVDSHGNYLSVLAGGVVRAEVAQTEAAKFKICFPVVEGILMKKGTSGLRRWQERYMAFNGNVMSYWRQQRSVGKERPNGIYHPGRMTSVNINRTVPKRFNIVFADGKIVELMAPTVEEAVRWCRGLNSRGIKTVQQTKRMSVVTDTVPVSKPAGASAASAVQAN